MAYSDPNRAALRVKDVVAASGLSKNTVHARIADGTLPSVKVGRARLIPRTSLEAFLTPSQAA